MGIRSSGFWVGLGGVLLLAGGCSSGRDEAARESSQAKGSSSTALAPAGAGTLTAKTAAAQALRQQFVGARTLTLGDVQRRVFGKTLANGATPADAA
jgi:hypothetical protein